MMPTLSLLDLQHRFSESMFDRELAVTDLTFKAPESGSIDKRLDIYRNNVFYSLTTALGDLYPVLNRLVGADFFKACARVYLQEHPPSRAAMVFFGENFAEFLSDFEHTKQHAWLADIARLELAWHQSYHAMDAAPLNPADLVSTAAVQLAQARVSLHPSLHLLKSHYPILQIWEANQLEEEEIEQIDLDSGGESVCIYRPAYQVILRRLDIGTFSFISALQQGSTLEHAIIAATDVEPEFVADQVLAQCLTDGLFEYISEDTL